MDLLLCISWFMVVFMHEILHPGDERNIKVTTPADLKIAQMLLEEMQ